MTNTNTNINTCLTHIRRGTHWCLWQTLLARCVVKPPSAPVDANMNWRRWICINALGSNGIRPGSIRQHSIKIWNTINTIYQLEPRLCNTPKEKLKTQSVSMCSLQMGLGRLPLADPLDRGLKTQPGLASYAIQISRAQIVETHWPSHWKCTVETLPIWLTVEFLVGPL